MDILTSAKHLQKLLILHDKADRHVHCLDRLIDDLGRTVLVRDLRHYSNNTSTLYLRLSVLQGVRLMLETFKLQTVKKVQKLSRDILTYLQTNTLVQQEADLNRNYPVAMDTAAWKYTASVEKTLRDD